jgi:hypothetical protein
MAGYSGTPLPQKLGIRPEFRVALLDLPGQIESELEEALAGCELAQDGHGPFDFVMLFVRSEAELKRQFFRFAKQLAPAGMLWVSWPKKSSGVATALDENQVRKIGLDAGLVDVKVCAVSEVWSGLKFVVRVKHRRNRQKINPWRTQPLPRPGRARKGRPA